MTADGKLTARSGSFTGDVVANSFKTNDGSITLANGKLTITGAEIAGTANTSSIGASTIYTNHLLEVMRYLIQERIFQERLTAKTSMLIE